MKKSLPLRIAALCMLAGVLVGHRCFAQSEAYFDLEGTVLDSETQKPLPGVNVFLANTMLGSATDDNGNFVIRRVPAGNYDIVASMMGYTMHKAKLTVIESNRTPMVFTLDPQILQAPEIEVSAEPIKGWKKDFEEFRHLFFSTTLNAERCAILNREILDFSRDGGVFRASAKGPLLIVNQALGFRIQYILESFQATDDVIRITRTPMYIELDAKSEQDIKDWRKNRLRAYRGSLRHFLRCVYESYQLTGGHRKGSNERTHLESEGFRVFKLEDPWGPNPDSRRVKVSTNDFVSKGELSSEWTFSFSDYLEVTYLNELEEDNYLAYINEYRKPKEQVSFITLAYSTVAVDTAGHFYDAFGIRAYGYWGWEREADKLPWGYTSASALMDEQILRGE